MVNVPLRIRNLCLPNVEELDTRHFRRSDGLQFPSRNEGPEIPTVEP